MKIRAPMLPNLRLVTYNIHSCRGTDNQVDVLRVARVLEELDADVIALQEVHETGATTVEQNQTRQNQTRQGRAAQSRSPQSQLATLTRELGMRGHFTKTRPQGDEHFGIATLVRHPFQVRAEGTLPSLRGEPRAAQWLHIRAAEAAVDLVNTHLSVNFFERVRQLRALVQQGEVEATPIGVFPRLPASDCLVLVGDFNAGYLSPEYRYLSRRLRNAQRCVRTILSPTFPSRFPFLRLDHVWIGAGWDVKAAEVVDSTQARLASDHLPLLVVLQPRMLPREAHQTPVSRCSVATQYPDQPSSEQSSGASHAADRATRA